MFIIYVYVYIYIYYVYINSYMPQTSGQLHKDLDAVPPLHLHSDPRQVESITEAW